MMSSLAFGRSAVVLAAVLSVCLFLGCTKDKDTQAGKAAEPAKVVQPAPPGTIRASHILFAYQGSGVPGATRTKEQALKSAQEILARAKAGEDFGELANTYSDDGGGQGGGDLGFFRKGQMVRPFEEAAFALRPGQISDIVETQFGYHIILRTQ
jgi:parvulin-like peptidyl-prolyl isomerase